jgi:nucleotide-binding universal stress UspA family protein
MSTQETGQARPLLLVVGFDGTEPAQRALQAATRMLEHSPGRMEVVFVAHMPVSVAFAAQASASVAEGLDTEEHDLELQVEEVVGQTGVKWHFQRRNGEIAPELLAAGFEQFDTEGTSAHIILVLGGTAHKVDRYLNSTPAKVLHKDQFEVLVVP